MNQTSHGVAKYIYTITYRRDEFSLVALEMRSLFNIEPVSSILESTMKINPSRSPFIRERIDVLFEGNQVNEIVEKVKNLQTLSSTFKVIFVQNDDLAETKKVGFKERRTIEREIGLHVPGEPSLLEPELLFGIMNVNGRWVFGKYVRNEAIWLQHQQKPHSYSTALSTRVARSVVNIAVPNPEGIKAIDPCCGIGTVLVEALSMGIDIVGSDINPLILPGVRENIAHFGFEGEVSYRDIRNVTNQYDVAIIDLPYNLCSVITPEETLEMLQSARRFAKKIVVITVEPIDSIIVNAGFEIVDRCVAKKGTFTREIIVCN